MPSSARRRGALATASVAERAFTVLGTDGRTTLRLHPVVKHAVSPPSLPGATASRPAMLDFYPSTIGD